MVKHCPRCEDECKDLFVLGGNQIVLCPEAVKTTEAEAIYYVIQHKSQAVR